MMLGLGLGFCQRTAAAGQGYRAQAVEFSSDRLSNTTLGTATQALSMNFFLKRATTATNTTEVIWSTVSGGGLKSFLAIINGVLSVVIMQDNHSTTLLSFNITLPDNDLLWHNFHLVAWTKNGAGTLSGYGVYWDETDITGDVTETQNNLNALNSGLKFGHNTESHIGDYISGGLAFNGSLANFWYSTAVQADVPGLDVIPGNVFNTEDLRRLIVDANGRPVYMEEDGAGGNSLAQSADTILYGPANVFNVNGGTRGDYTVTGSLADDSSDVIIGGS